MNKDSEGKFKVFNSFAQQAKNFCWTLDKPESTVKFGTTLTKKFPDLSILLLNGPIGAGKTTLVKGIAKSLGIQEPITSPTFPLSQHYPNGKRPLIHIDLYRIEDHQGANDFFLQEEEEAKKIEALMVIEWPDKLSLPLHDAWRGKLDYFSDNQARVFTLIPPSHLDKSFSTSFK